MDNWISSSKFQLYHNSTQTSVNWIILLLLLIYVVPIW